MMSETERAVKTKRAAELADLIKEAIQTAQSEGFDICIDRENTHGSCSVLVAISKPKVQISRHWKAKYFLPEEI